MYIQVDVPTEDFFYLAGPMTDYPQYNFPEFVRVADKLRERGYVICSPAELDDNLIHHECMASDDGSEAHLASDSEQGLSFLRRDVNIVMHPNCVGVICLPGWEESYGAGIETYIADKFKRALFRYVEEGDDFWLVATTRDEALKAYQRQKNYEALDLSESMLERIREEQ